MDLSSPVHGSVNDGIPVDWCWIQYASVGNAIAIIKYLGCDMKLAKQDLKDMLRIVQSILRTITS